MCTKKCASSFSGTLFAVPERTKQEETVRGSRSSWQEKERRGCDPILSCLSFRGYKRQRKICYTYNVFRMMRYITDRSLVTLYLELRMCKQKIHIFHA